MADEVAYRPVTGEETRRAVRGHWDDAADDYQAEHGAFLRDVGFVWCPEGWDEAEVGLLGDVAGRRVLEVGCGGAQCARWLAAQGAWPVALDLSGGQLRHAARLGEESGITVPLVLGDAARLPFADASFDLACSAFGAIGFSDDSAGIMREVSRVLRRGGRWVFSWSHPFRWVFTDSGALRVTRSYFDRTPYVESNASGPTYVEHHRTVGDRVREIAAAGLVLVDLHEPEWPGPQHRAWDHNWTAQRGQRVPGTSIWVTEKPAR